MVVVGWSLSVLLKILTWGLLGLLVGWTVGCLVGLRMGFGWLVGGPVSMVFLFVLAWLGC